jgi:hypothetical protein
MHYNSRYSHISSYHCQNGSNIKIYDIYFTKKNNSLQKSLSKSSSLDFKKEVVRNKTKSYSKQTKLLSKKTIKSL